MTTINELTERFAAAELAKAKAEAKARETRVHVARSLVSGLDGLDWVQRVAIDNDGAILITSKLDGQFVVTVASL